MSAVTIASSDLTAFLQGTQNPDGGWPYVRGSSWTEPTALTLLALRAQGALDGGFPNGMLWIESLGRPDGGWPAQPGVAFSSWVTALAALLFSTENRMEARDGALRWLLRQMGEETTLAEKIRSVLRGRGVEGEGAGWPWLPGNAARVTPTVAAILALQWAGDSPYAKEASGRAAAGRKFLLERACADGGWNHGSAEALGYAAHSYPETTGQALLALRGISPPQVAKAVQRAEAYLPLSRSAQGYAWLRLGLLAQGISPGPRPATPPLRCRSVMDAALLLLADNAERGRNVLWS